jgi:hypothetical protein
MSSNNLTFLRSNHRNFPQELRKATKTLSQERRPPFPEPNQRSPESDTEILITKPKINVLNVCVGSF